MLLERAEEIGRATPDGRGSRSASLRFIASCLRRNGDVRYKSYVREALRENVFDLRAWWLLLR